MTLPVSYYTRVKNVGDQTSPYLCKHITGQEVAFASTSQPHILGVGSILGTATRHSYVWGSGIMHPTMFPDEIRGNQVYAVRGKKTADELIKNGVNLKEVNFGDPGLLLPQFVDLKSNGNVKKYKLGIIPHYVDRFHPFILNHQNHPEVCILNVHETPDSFINTLAQCENVVSSSLHGIVFAVALNIPCAWIKLTDKVAGEGYKFADFFSVIDNPQKEPIKVTKKGKFEKFLPAAELRKFTENPNDLIDNLKSLVANHQNELEQTFKNRSFSFNFCTKTKPPLPAIVISYNRSGILQKCCESLTKIDPNIQLFIHDNGSDDPETLKTLDRMKGEGIQVIYRDKIKNADDLNLVNETVQEAISKYGDPPRYLVTDCDIDVSNCPPDTFEIYGKFLDAFPKVECVGPMLKIRDLSVTYPLFEHALNRHIDQFWHKKPEEIVLDGKTIFWQYAAIDTTLAMHRSAEPFKRLKSGIRLYNPYEAKHLDWYLSAEEILRSTYTKSSSKKISHWASKHFVNSWVNATIETPHYYYVAGNSSCLKIKKGKVTLLKSMNRALVKKFYLKKLLKKLK